MNEAEFRRQSRAATRRRKAEAQSPTRAVAARYNRRQHRIEIELANGAMFAFPPESAEGLAGARPKDLAKVEIVGPGTGLRWDTLDADLKVEALLVGVFGSKPWMRELARRAGQSRSDAKARAARINGRRGGRATHERNAPRRSLGR